MGRHLRYTRRGVAHPDPVAAGVAGVAVARAGARRTSRGDALLVSIVVPAYNEGATLPVLLRAIAAAMGARPYEVIVVDDGSTDDTFAIVEDLARADPRVRGLALARNFGHQRALAAGLRHARGAAVITMDADMQHPPALLPAMIAKWQEGYRVVQGVRRDTPGASLFKRASSRAFYRVFGALSGSAISPGMSDFRLVDRAVADQLNDLSEGDVFLRGLLAWMGYRQAEIPFDAGARHAGASKYSVRKMFQLAVTGLFAFSPTPPRIGVGVGLCFSLLSLAEFAYVLWMYASGRTVPGWASTVAVITLMFAIVFLLIGIQGEYLYRVYERVQRRPAFLVDRRCGWERRPGESDGPPGGSEPPARGRPRGT
jgi:dolichol-phosphate mannosyltransferase